MDLDFMVFLKTTLQPRLPQEEGQASITQWAIVKNLYEAATSWHNKKDAEPQNLNATLRTTLMYCMISMLCSKVEILETDEGEESLLKLEQLGLIEDGKFFYLRWNADLRRHEKAENTTATTTTTTTTPPPTLRLYDDYYDDYEAYYDETTTTRRR